MGLQKGDILCYLTGKKLKAFPGYYVDDGILAVYCVNNGTWTVGHVPSGYSLTYSFQTREEAVEYARKVRSLELFDWYELDFDALFMSGEIAEKFHAVGRGEITPEEFNVQVMMYKMGGIDE